MSEAFSEIIGAAERAVAGSAADRGTLERLLEGIDLAGIGSPQGRAYLAVLLDRVGLTEQAILALRPADVEHGSPGAEMPNLAGMLAAGHDDYEQALVWFLRALSAAGDGTSLRAKILANLAALSLRVGNADAAADWLAQAGDALAQPGDPATNVLLAATELGLARARGDLPGQREAVFRLNKATRARLAEIGSDHPLALTAVASLAAADFELAAAEGSAENQQRAITVLEVAAHRLAADLGADHPQALACLEDLCVADLGLALASRSMDRAARSTRELESLARRTTAAVGAGHPQARRAAANAALARQELGKAQAGETGAAAGRDGTVLRPWARSQARVAGSWPGRQGQPVSVALSPAAGRLALSMGPRLTVSDVTGRFHVETRFELACGPVPGLTWSPAGDKLAFRDAADQGQVLDLSESIAGAAAEARTVALGPANAVAFAPDGHLAVLAPSLPGLVTLRVMRPDGEVTWERALSRNRISGSHPEGGNLAWSPDGNRLACSTGTSTVWVFEGATGRPVRQFEDHTQVITGLSWIDDERVISAAADATLRVWRPGDTASATVVETIAAAGMVYVRERRAALVWSASGELLAWSLAGTPVQLWYRDPPSSGVAAYFARLAVSAAGGLLALVDAGTTDLLLVSDWDQVASAPAATTTYANAKVLLLGDSGVGKSGLAMVLAGEPFRATVSTRGRRIWPLPADPASAGDGDNREVMLWDLAGDPGYRIVQQLHLDGAALALILFDEKSETEPLAGVAHWAGAVRQSHSAAGGELTTFLIAARADRGGISVSDQRIRRLMADFGLDDYLQTSAKEGTNTDLLRSRVLASIDWEKIPEIASTTLFAAVKQFVVDLKESGSLLTPIDELGRMFQAAVPDWWQLLAAEEQSAGRPAGGRQEVSSARLASVFEGCVARLEAAGLVKRLKFGDYVLLQPDLLDTYTGAIVNAAREEPDGLGSILETKVISLDFAVPSAGRAPEGRQERLLVLAALEELLQRELVLREVTGDGVQLVFPAAYLRDLPEHERPRGDGVVFRFEGPILNIYATLIVRLARSKVFRRAATWQSAARFAADGGDCTVYLQYDGGGRAELRIGYDRMPGVLRRQFERFVHLHLEGGALPGSVTRERQYSCPHDGTAFAPEQVERVIRRGEATILCPVCENRIPLRDDGYEPADATDRSAAATDAWMDALADAGRDEAAASAVLRGKEEVAEFDVFLCHNWQDKPAVRELARQLRERGLRPWLDENELRPGVPWQSALQDAINGIPAAAVIVGSRPGPWHNQEVAALIREFVRRGCVIVPVLLPGASPPDLPPYLHGATWIDLAATEPDPISQLAWGINGKAPS